MKRSMQVEARNLTVGMVAVAVIDEGVNRVGNAIYRHLCARETVAIEV